MTRKAYHKLITERVAKLRDSDTVLFRVGKLRNPDSRPPIEELGDVFEHVYERIEQNRDDPIARAFVACELDLDNPFHWEDILRAVCELHFSPGKKHSPKKKSPEFLRRLKQDREALLRLNPKAGQSQQARELTKKYPDFYGKKPETLRRTIVDQDRKEREASARVKS